MCGEISKRVSISRSTVQSVIKKYNLFCSTEILFERGENVKLTLRTALILFLEVQTTRHGGDEDARV